MDVKDFALHVSFCIISKNYLDEMVSVLKPELQLRWYFMHSVPKWKREISIYQAKIWIKYLSQSKWKLHFESEIVQVEDSGTCQVFQIMLKFRFSSDGEGSWTFPEDFSTLPPQSLHQILQKNIFGNFWLSFASWRQRHMSGVQNVFNQSIKI